MFSALPLVFLVSTERDLSVSLMTAAALSPKNGKPPPGVAVASVTWVWALELVMVMLMLAARMSAAKTGYRAINIKTPGGDGRELREFGTRCLCGVQRLLK